MKNVLSLAGLGAVLAFAMSFALVPMPLLAADNNTVGVDPFYKDVRLLAAQSSTTTTIRLTNSSTKPRTFIASTVDFGGLDESGGLVFLGVNATELQKKYGLTKWLTVQNPQITLGPDQSADVAVRINNLSDLSPGGHYGAVVFNEAGSTAAGNIGVNQAITSLIFVSKIGGERYGMELSGASANFSPWLLPGVVNLNFHNTGNVHLTPRGTVEIVGPGGRVVSRGAINENSAVILPELHRTYKTDLQTVARIVWPGHYSLRISFRYDGQDKFTTVSKSFMFYNAPLGIAAGLFLLAVIALIVTAWRKHWIKRLLGYWG